VRSNHGKYHPSNPSKYKGDPYNIIYRSTLETKFMSFFDKHPNIVAWSSETVIIPYISPLDNRIHKYYVDFYIETKQTDGTIKRYLIEVKPDVQTRPPKHPKSKSRYPKYLEALKTWSTNEAKWKAAVAFCKQRGLEFKVLTEKDIKKDKGK
jgi:hypothetical protein